jgi:hypothetical protein
MDFDLLTLAILCQWVPVNVETLDIYPISLKVDQIGNSLDVALASLTTLVSVMNVNESVKAERSRGNGKF